jgi:hypothetical protein
MPDFPGRTISRGPFRRSARASCLVLLLLCSTGVAHAQQVTQVPSPAAHFGFTPGEDRQLADWHELSAFYDAVAHASPRVVLDTLGTSTRGLPFVMLTITSPANHGRLEELREIHMHLADPRTIASDDELRRLQEEARTVVLVTSHIHSTEVGAGQMPANLVHRLATAEDADALEILDRVILLLIPSLNPDGTQMIAEWYREHRGTPYEGAAPVELYHHYIGHDNNRDWYAITQVETQLTIEKAHNAWRPMIVHDVHQMGSTGARIFFPPYVEPFEPNVDPLIITAINQLGSYMAAELTTRGKKGVVTGAQYDLFTPARAYQHYHGGVRILSETASALLATPVHVRREELTDARGFSVREPSMNFPAPWDGGDWGLPDIVDYQESGAMALLKNAARNRSFWVENFSEINRRAAEGWESWPKYWVIPGMEADRIGLDAMLRILTIGSVEVHQALGEFDWEGIRLPAGSYVIPMRQPYASWAQTLLEVQDYPDLRDHPSGPPTRPYDVTAHTLPLLMGVRAHPVWEDLELDLSPPIAPPPMAYAAPAFLVGARAPRIAIYRGWRETIPAGWTRWLFDQHGIEYDALFDEDVRTDDLRRRYDVILFQDQSQAQIVSGWQPGQLPAEFTGGIGAEGLAALRRFVEEGGRLVAIESATDLVIDLFDLPVANRVGALPSSTFFIPGSILGLDVETATSIGSGTPARNAAWFWRASRAFEVRDPGVGVVARYSAGEPRLSGWVLGSQYLAGYPAIVEASIGRGSVVLFGFQPNYRGHSIATWPLLFNALNVRR